MLPEEEPLASEQEDEELRLRTLEGLSTVRKLGRNLLTLYTQNRERGTAKTKQAHIDKRLKTVTEQYVDQVESLNLHQRVKDAMLMRVKELGQDIRSADLIITLEIQRSWALPDKMAFKSLGRNRRRSEKEQVVDARFN